MAYARAVVGKRFGAALFVALLMLAGCDEDDGSPSCTYNSDCDAPLVCRSGACV